MQTLEKDVALVSGFSNIGMASLLTEGKELAWKQRQDERIQSTEKEVQKADSVGSGETESG